jgi:hypothetical protein
MRDKERIPGLLDEDFISVYPTLAVRAGINKAAILQKLHYLVRITENARNEANFIDGRWWVYNTYADWQKHYFPWLATSTLKMLFLALEKEGIVLVWTPPDNDQKKYYTIDYTYWPTWLAATPSKKCTGRTRTETRRDPSKESTTPVQKLDGGASKKDPTPVRKLDGSSIYSDSENTQNRLSETPQTTPTASAPIVESLGSTAPAGDAVDDDLAFVLPEIQKLGLTPKAQTELLALGAQKALAIALAAQGPGVRNPGGLAVSMMTDGPPKLDLERAEIALTLGTLDRGAIDEELRQREYARMLEQTNDWVGQKEGAATGENSPVDVPDRSTGYNGAEPPGAQASTDPEQRPPPHPAQGPPVDSGLSYRPRNGRLTILDIWRAALGELSLQLNRSTFEDWVKGTKAVSYADGVLTVQARHFMAHQMLTTRLDLSPTVSKMAGEPIQVRVVLGEEGVGR